MTSLRDATDAAHQDHALALALRQRSDPTPIADLATRARRRAEADTSLRDRQLAHARRTLRWIEGAALALIIVLAVLGLAQWDSQTGTDATTLAASSNGTTSDTADLWSEARWLAIAAGVAAIAYAVIARAEPLDAATISPRQATA